eukprot:15223096-Alexandrium_andersonii.AAC.1
MTRQLPIRNRTTRAPTTNSAQGATNEGRGGKGVDAAASCDAAAPPVNSSPLLELLSFGRRPTSGN